MERKPFDLEAALRGEPVVTRDGIPVKISGYNEDASPECVLVGWIDYGVQWWGKDGVSCYVDDQSYNLFMAPRERKEWVVRFYDDKYPDDVRIRGPFKDNLEAIDFAMGPRTRGFIHSIHEITIYE